MPQVDDGLPGPGRRGKLNVGRLEGPK
jgi:hypothetical protein